MATPSEHAVCSASASERWMHCTAAPRYEEQFPETSSDYGDEGRLAHSVCELFGRRCFLGIPVPDYESALDKLKQDPLFSDEMIRTADFYLDYLDEISLAFDKEPYVAFEVRVDFSDIVPEGFGTCDCIMVGGNTMRITDYKHGKGVPVSAVQNSQMRLYALGALKKYAAIYGDTITEVFTAIVQPRIHEDVEVEHLTVAELKEWGESVKPIAQKAFTGFGATFEPGDWCKFCRGKAVCRARAELNSAFADFKDCIPAGKLNDVEQRLADAVGRQTLSDEEVADLLTKAADLVAWFKDLQDYAQQAILSGRTIPGYKVVAGKSNRVFTDEDKVLSILTRKAHLKTADCYKPRELKTLATIEKMLGKKSFEDLLGHLVSKPIGKPTLVPASDKRESYDPAVADFAGVAGGQDE